jgi:hypothetical protein
MVVKISCKNVFPIINNVGKHNGIVVKVSCMNDNTRKQRFFLKNQRNKFICIQYLYLMIKLI